MSGRRHDTPPEAGSIRPFTFPDVVGERLDNGLEVRVARMARLPVVSVALVLPAGESVVDDEEGGLAILTGDALEGGTGSRSGEAFAEALERLGASLSIGTGWDATTLTASFLAERKAEVLGLLSELVLDPAFPPDEVARSRSQHLAQIRERRMRPGALASDAAARLFYAEGVPYGRPSTGAEASVSPLGPDALRRFVLERYRPGGAALVVAGDVDPDEILRLADDRFGGWEGAPDPDRDFEARPRSDRREVHVVDRPGSVQSALHIGHPGAPKSTPDYFPLVVANTVLGGAFTSRLNLNLRERHGYTYGVRSRFAFRRNAGPFRVTTSVDTGVTALAVREIVGEIEAMAAVGPDQDETRAARDYVAGVFPLRLETTRQLAHRLAELRIYDLPDDWHARYRDRIRAVERDAAAAAAGRHLRPDELQVVVVGDAAEVAGPLEELGLGPLTVHRDGLP